MSAVQAQREPASPADGGDAAAAGAIRLTERQRAALTHPGDGRRRRCRCRNCANGASRRDVLARLAARGLVEPPSEEEERNPFEEPYPW